MVCQNCGNQLNEGAAFCPKCGNSVRFTINSVTDNQPKKKKSKIGLIIGLFVIIAAIAIAIAIKISNSPERKAEKALVGYWTYSYNPYYTSIDSLNEYLSDKPDFPKDSIMEEIQYDLDFFPNNNTMREEITLTEYATGDKYRYTNWYTYTVSYVEGYVQGDNNISDHLIIWTAPEGQELPDTSTSGNCKYYVLLENGVPSQIVTNGAMPLSNNYEEGRFTR